MITRSEAVGGTEFTLYSDLGRVIATAVLHGSESEGAFVAHLLAWLNERHGAPSRERPVGAFAESSLRLVRRRAGCAPGSQAPSRVP